MNYNETKKQLVEYYKNLLIVQYHDKPKAKATIALLIEELLADMLIFKIRDNFNVDTDIGVQLDIDGDWVGVDRFFKGQKFDNHKWFSLIDWNKEPNTSLQGGFQDWNEPLITDGGFLYYDMIISTKNKLENKDFRFLIKLKIIKNAINHTAKNIDESIYELFKNEIYTTWGEYMELTYHMPKNRSTIMNLAKEKKVIPVPSGVTLKFEEY